ncbi:formate dehydrogenase family accessory protein FdhD [Sphingopyxis sp. Root1497]|uniref:formate dehydrogenase accessory sulfurtransferase FdhD n=1 Tax=Sphingopyxis sp. Root1497 TaxID=1736474 RepID=UPI000700B5B7|nr:formate dehydrogenase accessory sulfurtransferase FdhD [Sphingopyxis sp. Root1497]KQZ60773.1 formate dehydrogenase family accessory protein FdhD [Sphingopyxis sp. Root1497]
MTQLQTLSLAMRRLDFAGTDDAATLRDLPIEAPVSVEVCGIGYAVMMATPSDLEDYAIGFALGEALVETAAQIRSIDVHPVEGGVALRIWLPPERTEKALERARKRVSESSCGLCGMENIEQVLRPLPTMAARIATDRAAIAAALAALPDHQPLGRATGAAHAAAFCAPNGDILRVREDVGRHNALDKLIGALARDGIDAGSGFILLSARCSYELVEKTVRAGCPMLVTISAATSLAAERAVAAGLTLVTLARADSALIVGDPHGMIR